MMLSKLLSVVTLTLSIFSSVFSLSFILPTELTDTEDTRLTFYALIIIFSIYRASRFNLAKDPAKIMLQ